MSEDRKPTGFEDDLGQYETLYQDSTCGEPIMWGWKIVRPLSEERFTELKSCGMEVLCLAKGNWVVAARRLRHADAIAAYGPVTDEEFGPRGAWKSTTYGRHKFGSRYMAPGKR